jgi:hypothetical protein
MKEIAVVIASLFLSACGTLCRDTKDGDQCRQTESHFHMDHEGHEFGRSSRD